MEVSVYTVKKHDRVHELPDVTFPSSGTPEPLVLANEDTLVVAYLPAAPSSEQASGAGLGSAGPARTIIVVFHECYAIHFGLPNDEAFASHPLADRGLRPCGAFEVEDSSWLRGLEMRNRAHPRHNPELFQRLHHWVWTFHDSVLECAARSYEAMDAPGRSDEAIPRMQALLRTE
jgi:hypothetical protein